MVSIISSSCPRAVNIARYHAVVIWIPYVSMISPIGFSKNTSICPALWPLAPRAILSPSSSITSLEVLWRAKYALMQPAIPHHMTTISALHDAFKAGYARSTQGVLNRGDWFVFSTMSYLL